MKPVKYPLFGKWLEKVRESHSHQWIGKRIGKEHNTVSDYANGYSRPPKLIVALLINLFEANPLEIADFLFYDPFEIQDLCRELKTSGLSVNDFKTENRNQLNATRKFREIGDPNDALSLIQNSIFHMESRIEADIDSQKDIQDIKYILLRAYGEKIACISVLFPREKVFPKILQDHSRMTKLSMDLDNKYCQPFLASSPVGAYKAIDIDLPSFSGLAYSDSWLAAGYFVTKNYEKAIYFQKKAIPHCGFDKNLLAETYRGLILSLAHAKQGKEFIELEMKISLLFGKEIQDPKDIDSLKCAFAEARMYLGKDGSKKILDEVEGSIFNADKFLPLKIIQFYKTQLLLMRNDLVEKKNINTEKILEVSKKGYSLAKSYGYERHAEEISLLGKTITRKGKLNLKKPKQLAFIF